MAELHGALIGVLSVAIGFAVARWYEIAGVRERTHARVQALRAEVVECGRRASILQNADGGTGMTFVGYTLPDWVGREVLGQLAADGLLSEVDARVLINFYATVGDANMNLARARSDAGVGGIVAIQFAASSARGLTIKPEQGVSLLEQAQGILTKIIDDVARWHWWHPFLARRK